MSSSDDDEPSPLVQALLAVLHSHPGLSAADMNHEGVATAEEKTLVAHCDQQTPAARLRQYVAVEVARIAHLVGEAALPVLLPVDLRIWIAENAATSTPALCEGVPELPPFPMKCTVLPEFLVFSTNFQNSSNCSTGNSEIVEIMSLK